MRAHRPTPQHVVARLVGALLLATATLAGGAILVPTATPAEAAIVEPLGVVAGDSCDPGEVKTSEGVCRPCDHGYYDTKDGEGVAKTHRNTYMKDGCTPAEPGFHVPTTGATAQEPCNLGTYADVTALRNCKPAAPGQFVPVKAATKAEVCPAGTYQPKEGQTACFTADRGYYVPTAGAATQTVCATATTTGSKTCPVAATPAPTPAPEPEPEDDADDDADAPPLDGDLCPAGSWSPNGLIPNASSCTPASPGTFVAEAGASEEVACEPGTYSAVFGATECTAASIGFYVPEAGSSAQLPCPSASEPGAATCDAVLAVDASTGSSGRLLPILVALVAVLAAAATFVVLRQRGLLGGARPLPAIGDAWAGFDDVTPRVTPRPEPDAWPEPGPEATRALPPIAEPPPPPTRPMQRFADDFDNDLDDL
jgi:hypothetical protein